MCYFTVKVFRFVAEKSIAKEQIRRYHKWFRSQVSYRCQQY